MISEKIGAAIAATHTLATGGSASAVIEIYRKAANLRSGACGEVRTPGDATGERRKWRRAVERHHIQRPRLRRAKSGASSLFEECPSATQCMDE